MAAMPISALSGLNVRSSAPAEPGLSERFEGQRGCSLDGPPVQGDLSPDAAAGLRGLWAQATETQPCTHRPWVFSEPGGRCLESRMLHPLPLVCDRLGHRILTGSRAPQAYRAGTPCPQHFENSKTSSLMPAHFPVSGLGLASLFVSKHYPLTQVNFFWGQTFQVKMVNFFFSAVH